jgi:hypothetical protein
MRRLTPDIVGRDRNQIGNEVQINQLGTWRTLTWRGHKVRIPELNPLWILRDKLPQGYFEVLGT